MLKVELNAGNLQRVLANAQKRLRFAASYGLNSGAKQFQKDQRERLPGEVTLRKGPFMNRQIAYIPQFSHKDDEKMEVSVFLGDGKQPNLLLSMLETGGERPAFGGGAHIAVPVIGSDARPDFANKVPNKFTFSKLALHKEGGRIIGKARTYIVPGVGVFERTNPKLTRQMHKLKGQGKFSTLKNRGQTQLIYSFKTNQHVRPRFTWLQSGMNMGGYIAQRTAQTLSADLERFNGS